MIVRRHRRHDEATRYSVFVLWLIGHPESSIALFLGLRRKQVAGVIADSEYAGRASMTDSTRAAKLQELVAIRFLAGPKPLDGGLLDKVPFEIKPLAARQRRAAGRRRG